ncbi:MAG: hypothetical protein ABJF11_05675 [Reichenbachiella sp.]|uniref:Vgb family protein n=1 Tax=Reichenbachiella sp. TaxID=2184521 RepID=UPI0032662046
MMRLLILRTILFLILLVSLANCGSDEDSIEVLDTTPVVTDLVLIDTGNNNNAGDFEVTLTLPSNLSSIEELRVIVGPVSKISALSLAEAESLGKDQYASFDPKTNYLILQLKADQLDIEGSAIAEDIAYSVVVLSIGDPDMTLANGLSKESNSVTLTQRTALKTLAIIEDTGTGGMQVDEAGIIYMGDFGITSNGGGARVYSIKPSGDYEIFANGFNTASGNDIDADGVLYQASFLDNSIFQVDEQGNTQLFTSGTIFSGPVGMAFGDDGKLYSTNYNNNVIVRTTKAKASDVFARSSLFNGPNGLDFDKAGNLYVSNWNSGDIVKIPAGGGDPELLATTPSARNAHLILHEEIIYIVGRSNHVIYKMDLEGKISDFVGSGSIGLTNGLASESSLYFPNDIAFNEDGTRMYINHVHPSVTSSTTLSPTVIREVSIVK